MDVITATDVLLASGHGASQSGDTYSADCTYIYEIYIAPSCPLLHIFWYLVALFLPAVEGSFSLSSRGFALQCQLIFLSSRVVLPCSIGRFSPKGGQFSLKVGQFSPAVSGSFPRKSGGFPLQGRAVFPESRGVFPCRVGGFSPAGSLSLRGLR